MAILNVCAVFDKQAEAFGRPIFVPAKGLAIRSFIDEVNRESPDNHMHKYAADYSLYYIADFDESVGVFIPLANEAKVLLMGGDSAKGL